MTRWNGRRMGDPDLCARDARDVYFVDASDFAALDEQIFLPDTRFGYRMRS